jgi:DNA polymerase-3 subunit epsilon
MGGFFDWLTGVVSRNPRPSLQPCAPPPLTTPWVEHAPQKALTADVLKEMEAARAGRSIIIDCETTGLSWAKGDRIVSLACIEMEDGFPTGQGVHLVFNPGCPSSPHANRVHGLSDAYLSRQPQFSQAAAAVREFIGGSRLVAHNASFDFGFVNNEMALAGQPQVTLYPVCTMQLYRRRFFGKAALDTCCSTYGIDRSARDKFHGAFVDASLTAALFQGVTDPRSPPFNLVTIHYTGPSNEVVSTD